MLYQELIDLKFDERCPPAGKNARGQDVPARNRTGHQDVSTPLDSLFLVASIAGNMIAGAAFLGFLLMTPMWLNGLMAVLK